MRLPPLRAIALLLIAIGGLAGADTPTNEEWQPVADAIAAGDADAEAKVQAVAVRFPRWADGWTELARVQLDAQHAEAALDSARKALALSPLHGEAPWLRRSPIARRTASSTARPAG
jgi:hypothetical protein